MVLWNTRLFWVNLRFNVETFVCFSISIHIYVQWFIGHFGWKDFTFHRLPEAYIKFDYGLFPENRYPKLLTPKIA